MPGISIDTDRKRKIASYHRDFFFTLFFISFRVYFDNRFYPCIRNIHTAAKHADAVRSKEAQAALEKLLTIDPDTGHKASIYYQLGYVMYVDERYDDAIVYYDKLIDGYPDTKHHDEALQMEARVYYSLDQKDKCLEVYQVYLDRHPDDPGAMNGFAWFCAKRGFGFEQALPVALKAADLSDRDPGVLDTLAELYFAMGDYDNAIEVGKEALDKEPDDKYFKDQLEKYRKAASEQARR